MKAATVAYVGLGANLAGANLAGVNLAGVGTSPAQTLSAATDALGTMPQTCVDAASRLYVSDPVDADGPRYFNRVARLRTRLPAPQLLEQLHSIERRFGRERPYRNAPRTLDLDLLLLGDQLFDTPSLVLPHPRLHQRLFVLMPLTELDPDLVIPGLGKARDHLEAVQAAQTQRCAVAA